MTRRRPGILRVALVPRVPTMIGASTVAQLPLGMMTVALLLFGQSATGSLALGGTLVATFYLSTGVASPVLGRAVDRRGSRGVLRASAVVHVCSLLLLIVLPRLHATTAMLVLTTALMGASVPPISGSQRRLWPLLLAEHFELQTPGFALDAVLVEMVFIVGPLLAALAIALTSPAGALAVAGILTGLGIVWFTALPQVGTNSPSGDASIRAAVTQPPVEASILSMIGAIAAVAFAVGSSTGSIEIALPAFALGRGEPATGGLLIALLGCGSVLGGLMLSGRLRRGQIDVTLAVLTLLIPLGSSTLLLADSSLGMFVLVPLAGLAIAPLTTLKSQIIADVVPPARLTEAFAWLQMATLLGVACGSIAASQFGHAHGWRAAVIIGCLFGLAGLVPALLARQLLTRSGSP